MLTDIQMPRLDGIQLGLEVGRLQPHLPVAYMSGHADAAELLSADQRANCYIAKPFTAEALIDLIRKCIAFSSS